MKKLLLLAFLAGCGGQIAAPDMDEPVVVDLGDDFQPEKPTAGLGPGGLKIPPCARPEIDQCLGPPARSDVLQRPVEMEIDTN